MCLPSRWLACQVGDKVFIAPVGETATVKAIHGREQPQTLARVGDNVDIGLTALTGAAAVADALAPGDVLCDPAFRVPLARRIRAQVITFSAGADPILRGHQCVIHMQSLKQPCKVTRLLSIIDRASGEVKRVKPRMLGDGVSALIEIKFQRAVCLEKYCDYKQLGRFTLRRHGKTIAAGIVVDIEESKPSSADDNKF